MNRQRSVTAERSWEVLAATLPRAALTTLVLVVPLYLNPWSATNYEPDKALLLQWLAGLMAVGFAVVTVARRIRRRDPLRPCPARRRGSLRHGVVAVAAAWFLTRGLSTMLSIDPRASWYGSYDRRLGTATMLACGVAFLLATRLEAADRARVRRAVGLLGSVLAAYALLQWAGIEPLPVAVRFSRSYAPLGNPIFLGSVLLLTVFVTAAEAAVSLRRRRGGVRLAAAALLQLLGVAASGSRGPFVGLLAGLVAVGVMAPWRAWARRRAAGRKLAVVSAVGLAVACLMIVLSPRLGALSPWGGADSATARFRLEAWRTVSDMLLWQARAKTATDRVAAPVRVLVGFGPETLDVAVWPWQQRTFAGTQFARERLDRTHNELLDEFARGGSLGLTATLLLWCAVLAAWSRRAHLLPDAAAVRRSARRVAVCSAGCLAVAVAVTRSLQLLGLALAGGVFLGWAVSALREGGQAGGPEGGGAGERAADRSSARRSSAPPAAALLFWVLAGMAVAAPAREVQGRQRPERGLGPSGFVSAWENLLAAGLAALVLLLDTVGTPRLRPSLGGNLRVLLTGGAAGLSHAPLWLLLAGAWAAWLASPAQRAQKRGPRQRRPGTGTGVLLSLLLVLLGVAIAQGALLARAASVTEVARAAGVVGVWRLSWSWLSVAFVLVWVVSAADACGAAMAAQAREDRSLGPAGGVAAQDVPGGAAGGSDRDHPLGFVPALAGRAVVLVLLAAAAVRLPACMAPTSLRCAEAGVWGAFARAARPRPEARQLAGRAAALCPEVPRASWSRAPASPPVP